MEKVKLIHLARLRARVVTLLLVALMKVARARKVKAPSLKSLVVMPNP